MLALRRDRQEWIAAPPVRVLRWAWRLFRCGRIVLLAAVTWVSLGLTSPSFALDDSKQGVLGHLARYIGTSNYKAVIDDQHVRQRLTKLLGPRLGDLRRNLVVARRMDYVDGWLVLEGNRPHEGDIHGALVIVNLQNGLVHAVLFERGFVWVYANENHVDSFGKAVFYNKEKDYALLPTPMLHWIRDSFRERDINRPAREKFEWVR